MIGLDRERREPDAAVAVIVGAILFTGIVLGAIVTVRLTFVPVWEEEAESAHMDEVAKRMAELTSDVNRRLDNSSRAPLAVSLPMVATGGNNVFSTTRSPGTLEFNPGVSPMQLDTPSLLVQVRNGTDLAGVNETWDNVGSSNEIENVTEMLNLRLNITDTNPADGEELTLTIVDSRGKFAGDFTVYMENDPPDLNLHVRVRAPTSPPTVVYDNRELSIHQTNWAPPYWINTLNDDYRFDRLLDAARTPYDITLQENPLEGSFAATYAQSVSSGGGGTGTIIVGGGGIEDEDYARTFSGGTLTFESQNNEFIDQRYVIENGALILNQSDGAAFKVEPPFEIDRTPQTAIVNVGLPALTGESSSLAGSRSGRVQLSTSSAESIVGSLGDLNLTFHTNYPDLWTRHLEDELEAAGFPAPTSCPPQSGAPVTCEYEVTTGSRRVKLALHGPTDFEAAPTDPSVRDISLTFNTGSIRTVVR